MRAALLAVLAIAAVVTAGCGGDHAAGTAATTTSSPASQHAEIKRVWERFFSGATSASEKEALLEDGDTFHAVIEAQAASPLAKQSSATVTRVALSGPAKAVVVYTIELSHKPVLTGRRGNAVKVDGSWKVGRGSFCKLLALQGSVPKPCTDRG